MEGMGECLNCHGPAGIKPGPANHAAFTPDICTNCHKANVPGVPPGAAPAIPHQTEGGMAECKNCHAEGGIKPWPANHAAFTPDICANCHQAPSSGESEGGESEGKSEDVPAIPHDLAGRDDCLMCHNPEGGMKPAPKDHVGRTADQCQTCHKPK